MSNEELESLKSFYISLKKCIFKTFGSSLLPIQKQKLENLDFNKDIVIESYSDRPVYIADGKLHIYSEYYSEQLKNQLAWSNPGFIFENVLQKLSSGSFVTTEEIIIYSKQLKLSTEDLIKSCSTQEVLKYIMNLSPSEVKEKIVADGVVEYFAQELGKKLGIVVATPKDLLPKLEMIEDVQKETKIKLEEKAFNDDLSGIVEEMSTSSVKQELDVLREAEIEKEKKLDTQEIIEAIEDTAELKLEGLNELSIENLDDKNYLAYEKDGQKRLKEINTDIVNNEVISSDNVTSKEVFESVPSIEEKFVSLNDIDYSYLTEKQINQINHMLEYTKTDKKSILINIDENGNIKFMRTGDDNQVLSTKIIDNNVEIKEAGVSSEMDLSSVPEINQSAIIEEKKVITDEEALEIERKIQEGFPVSDEEKNELQQYYNSSPEIQEIQEKPLVRELNNNGFMSIVFATLIAGAAIGSGITLALVFLPK